MSKSAPLPRHETPSAALPDERRAVRYYCWRLPQGAVGRRLCYAGIGVAEGLSPEGVALRLGHDLEPGAAVLVRLRGEGDANTCLARVTDATPAGKRSWVVRCRWAAGLTQP